MDKDSNSEVINVAISQEDFYLILNALLEFTSGYAAPNDEVWSLLPLPPRTAVIEARARLAKSR